MKKVLFIVALFIASFSYSQTTTTGRQSNAIYKMADKLHYQPKPLDETLGQYVFDEFISAIDPAGFYFLQSDIDQLKDQYYSEVHQQIENSTSGFFNEAATIFKKRLNTADSFPVNNVPTNRTAETDDFHPQSLQSPRTIGTVQM